jgi:hypothetical protein
MTNNEMRALELYHQLLALSPDDGETAARVTIRAADGRLVGDVLLNSRDLEAATDALVSLNAYAQDERDNAQQLHPDALAEVEAHFASLDLGDQDGGA